MQMNKFLSNLGLAKRANKIIFGFDEVVKCVDMGKAYTVFVTSDASSNTLRRIQNVIREYDIKVTTVPFTMYDIGDAAGRKPTAVFTVTDKGFDQLLHKSLHMNGGNA